MANREHLKILKKGVKAWNKWKHDNPYVFPMLRGALLSKRNLRGADFNGVDLMGANLSRSDLRGANLSATNLSAAKLIATNLRDAQILFANLTQASLARANLTSAALVLTNLTHTDLDQTNLTRARLGAVIFAGVDLSTATGLETVQHDTWSTIGTDTLYLSKGKIPETFLRGCGLPDEMIEFARSIARSSIEFNSCFISYSAKDDEFAKRLHNDLQGNGVRCWFAPHHMKGGKKLHEQIDRAIHFHDRTLLILSPDSINSHWVKTEIAKARKREIEEKRQVLFPIRLVNFKTLLKWEYFDGDTGTDYAKEIREYFIPDFSNWKEHDSYQTALKKLLQDLQGERSPA